MPLIGAKEGVCLGLLASSTISLPVEPMSRLPTARDKELRYRKRKGVNVRDKELRYRKRKGVNVRDKELR